MHGLPKDLDLSFFIGKRLDTICFSEFTMSFTFEGGITISLSSAYQHRTKRDVEDHRAGVKQSVPVVGSTLMSVIGCSVVAANGDDEGTLMLEFDDGQIVAFIEDRIPYESFVIKNGEDEYYV